MGKKGRGRLCFSKLGSTPEKTIDHWGVLSCSAMCREIFESVAGFQEKRFSHDTHDLLLLNNLCSSAGIFLEVDPKLLNTLSDFAVRTRYPGEEPKLTDAKEAIETTKLIRSFAKKFLGI